MKRLVMLASLGAVLLAAEVGAADVAPAAPIPLSTPSHAAGSVPLDVRATPIFGSDSAPPSAWSEFLVTLTNGASGPLRGELTAGAIGEWATDQATSAVAFNVPKGATVTLKLPLRLSASAGSGLTFSAKDEKGKTLGEVVFTPYGSGGPTLLHVANVSRLASSIRGATVPFGWTPGYSGVFAGSGSRTTLSVATPSFDPATGDPILPDHAAAYGAITSVVVSSDVVVKLPGSERAALETFLRNGGSLFIIVSRPEDLANPALVELSGEALPSVRSFIHAATSGASLGPISPRPRGAAGGIRFDGPAGSDDGSDDDRAPYRFLKGEVTPVPDPFAQPSVSAPTITVQHYAGPGFSDSRLGASVAHGMGTTYLVGADIATPPALGESSLQSALLSAIAASWDRRADEAIVMGRFRHDASRNDAARRALDPNEGFRLPLGVAAIILVAYSILVGPILFLRAKRKGQIVRPVFLAPLLSGVAFFLVFASGFVERGFRGRARRTALTELGTGEARGVIRRFRGYYSGDTHALEITAGPGALPAPVLENYGTKDDTTLRVDRDKATLDGLSALPWQTAVVSEDGPFTMPGAVDLARNATGKIAISNRSGRALSDVLAWVPHAGLYYFAELRDGASAVADTGKFLVSAAALRSGAGVGRAGHPLDLYSLASALPTTDFTRIRGAWEPFEFTSGEDVNWFPDDRAVVLAEVLGGEGVKEDAHLHIDKDTLLLRVLGKVEGS